MSDEHGTASYREAGVDYDALDAGKRLAIAKALSTSPLLAARGARALDASRGEPAFVFELDGRAFAFVVEGLGTKSIIARQVLEAAADQPLRRRRLRHRRGDPQRPLLRRRAAARRQRLLRDGRLGVVPRRRALGGAARGLAAGLRRRRLRVGGRRVAVAARARRRARHRAGRRGRRRRAGGRSPILGERARGRAMRSCSSPRAACTPTAPRWRG